jgi:hypothetical protein
MNIILHPIDMKPGKTCRPVGWVSRRRNPTNQVGLRFANPTYATYATYATKYPYLKFHDKLLALLIAFIPRGILEKKIENLWRPASSYLPDKPCCQPGSYLRKEWYGRITFDAGI